MAEKIPAVPEVLRWARTSAGLSVAAAAKKLTVSETRIEAWEDGSNPPSIVQLRNMGTAYKRPLAVLLLSTPPKDFDALRDFRRTSAAADWSPALHAEFKRALGQREVLLELDEFAPGSVPDSGIDYQFPANITAEDAGGRLRALLGMDHWPKAAWRTPPVTLKAAITAVEDLGVLVVQATDISITEMRGFSISHWPHPVIVLNASDWPRPKLFTLLHELAHLALNSGGVCDLHEARSRSAASEVDNVEHFCNRAAASALMPADAVMALSLPVGYDWPLDELGLQGNRFGASAEAFLLRLVELKLATWDFYWLKKPDLDKGYDAARAAEKAKQKLAPGGPSYYVLKGRALGYGYVHSVLDAYQSRAISSYDVADYLDVQYHQLDSLSKAVG